MALTGGSRLSRKPEHDLSKYLDRWLQADSPNAHGGLAAMIVQQGLPNAKSPGGGYWAGHREQWERVNDWLRRPEFRQTLADGFERRSDSSFEAN